MVAMDAPTAEKPQTEATAIGRNIRLAREQFGITQPALAKLVGRGQSAISDWERGRRIPNGSDIKVLADTLQVTADSLLATDLTTGS